MMLRSAKSINIYKIYFWILTPHFYPFLIFTIKEQDLDINH